MTIHNCSQKPDEAILHCVALDEQDGKWWLVEQVEENFLVGLGLRSKKERELADGRCPWCKANLAFLVTVWPHKCQSPGRGAHTLVSISEDLPQIKLEIDPSKPTQARYMATFAFTVKECPDCGAKLFEE